MEFFEDGGKAEAVDESESEGDGPEAFFEKGADVVEGGDYDGGGDGGFDEARGELNPAEGRGGEGDGVSDREGGDDFYDVEQGRAQLFERDPGSVLAAQD